VTLHDAAYNADRNISTGNPYKALLADLMKRGVRVELCGATAQAHHWGNANLLPGILVNTDAMARTTQLCRRASSRSRSDARWPGRTLPGFRDFSLSAACTF
jgi:hypothetical protein